MTFFWSYERNMKYWHAFYPNNPEASLCLIVDQRPAYWHEGTAPPARANGHCCPICRVIVTEKLVEGP